MRKAMWALVMISIVACGFSDDVERNKRVNYDFCRASCADAGTPMKTFEQGLGYVKCECGGR